MLHARIQTHRVASTSSDYAAPWARTVSSYRRPLCHSEISNNHSPESQAYEFTYEGSDGRKKATFEQAFKATVRMEESSSATAERELAPWDISYQMSEKNLVWNEELKSRLVTRVAADELGLTEEVTMDQVDRLQALLPDVSEKLAVMKPSIIVRLLRDLDRLPERIMALKATFPNANVSRLSIREPALVLGFVDGDHLRNVADQLREMLPSVDVDKLVEENPSVLDVEELRRAMAEAERIMPNLDIEKAMGYDPHVILSFQRGSQLIPYDPTVPEDDGANLVDDDEYNSYYR